MQIYSTNNALAFRTKTRYPLSLSITCAPVLVPPPSPGEDRKISPWAIQQLKQQTFTRTPSPPGPSQQQLPKDNHSRDTNMYLLGVRGDFAAKNQSQTKTSGRSSSSTKAKQPKNKLLLYSSELTRFRGT